MPVAQLSIKFKRHDASGLIVAYSPDHKGFIVHGRTIEEVNERIPSALKALLAAEGKAVVSVRRINGEQARVPEFFPPEGVRFEAELTAA